MVRTYLALLVTFGLGALGALLFPYQTLTPGPLQAGHQQLRGQCFTCHTPLKGVPQAACAACHKPGEIGLRSVRGLALAKPSGAMQAIHQAVPGDCGQCHTEHGNRFGVGVKRAFAHTSLPPSVVNACATCHGKQRPRDQVHAALVTECSTCHGTQGWKPAIYNHDRQFQFDRHHPARCTDCHQPGASLKDYSCTGCHEHSLDRMQRKHREERIVGNLESCRKCHPSGNERDTIKPGGGRERREGKDEQD